MSDNRETVKLIIEIPKEVKQVFDNAESNNLKGGFYDYGGIIGRAIQNGIPLDNDSERAEVQSYFAGEAYGWEQGRKALLEELNAEVDKAYDDLDGYDPSALGTFANRVSDILDNIGNAESIDPNDMTCMFEGVTEVPKDAFKGWHTDELLEQIRKKNNDNPEDTGCDHND